MVIEKGIVNLTSVRFVTLRHARHLYMTALWSIFAEFDSQVAFHDLHMVEVHLQHQILGVHFLENVKSLGLHIEKEARYIACVDSFNQKGYAVLGEFSGGELEVRDVCGFGFGRTDTFWNNTGHRMEPCSLQFFRILNRGRHSHAKFFFATWQTRCTAFA